MDPTLFFLMLSLGVPPAGLLWLWQRRKHRARRLLCDALSLQEGDDGALSGSADGVHVVIRLTALGNEGNEVSAHVELLDALGPPAFDLSAQGFTTTLLSGPDLDVGDPAFDEVVYVKAADPSEALAALSPEAREAVGDAVQAGWSRQGARWAWERDATTEQVLLQVRLGVRACTALRQPGTLTTKLEARTRDPSAGVRAHAWRALMARDAVDEATLRGLLAAHDDLSVDAAARLGEEGRAWLSDHLARWPRDRRLLAALALAPHEPEPSTRLEAILLEGLRGPRADACVDALAFVGGAAALPALQGRSGAEAAVASILARREATAGQVSLVEVGPEGAVSLSRDP